MADEKDNITLNEAIDQFKNLSRYLPTNDEKNAAGRIFGGNNLKKFIYEYSGGFTEEADEPLDKRLLVFAIEAFVKNYSRDKDTVIDIFKKFTEFLKREHDITVEIEWPPIRVSDTRARRKYIVEYLQDNQYDFYDLRNILWISERTLENDYSYLSGGNLNDMTVGGLPFSVQGMERSNGEVRFDSSASIVEFAANVSEIIAVLEGLRLADENPYHRHKAERMARIIWQQLSDYTRGRLMTVAREGAYDCDIKWLEKLDSCREERSFHTEAEYLAENGGAKGSKNDQDQKFQTLAHFMKNGIGMRIEYREDNGETRVYECSAGGKLRTDRIGIKVSDSQEEKEMLIENIVSICRL